mgnify:CR=1 FL=1
MVFDVVTSSISTYVLAEPLLCVEESGLTFVFWSGFLGAFFSVLLAHLVAKFIVWLVRFCVRKLVKYIKSKRNGVLHNGV